MLKRLLGKRAAPANAPIEALVARAQAGDDEVRNRLLREYQSFVARVASRVCGRYIHPGHDDEFSIALLAFDEAIQHYSPSQGRSFLSFADLVIRRRVIDYIRQEARQKNALSLDDPNVMDEEREVSGLAVQASLDLYGKERANKDLQEEIALFQARLAAFGVSLAELPEVSPSHRDAREHAISVAKTLADDPELRRVFLETKKLPMKRLLQKVACSRKTLERNRKYIVAIALIMIEDFEQLRAYVREVLDERRDGE